MIIYVMAAHRLITSSVMAPVAIAAPLALMSLPRGDLCPGHATASRQTAQHRQAHVMPDTSRHRKRAICRFRVSGDGEATRRLYLSPGACAIALNGALRHR